MKNTSASTVGCILTAGTPPFGIYPGGTTCTGGSLAAGASCKVTVWFSPTVTGSFRGSLQVLADGSGPDAVGTVLASGALSGEGLAPYVITPSSSSTQFGNWAIGSASPTYFFTVTNRRALGGPAGAITAITLTNPDFISNGYGYCFVGMVLAPKQSCEVDARFAPTSAGLGTATGQLRVEFGSEAPVTVNLVGQKARSIALSPSPLAFGTVGLGSSSTKTVTVSRQANGAVTVGLGVPTVSPAGPFSVTGTTCGSTVTLTCTIDVTFTPIATGSTTAKLKLPVADSVSGPYTPTVNLSGTGGL